MLSPTAVQDLLRMMKSAYQELKRESSEELGCELDMNGWSYEFNNRYYSHQIVASLHWEMSGKIRRNDPDADMKYWEEMGVGDRQFQELQELVNKRLAKSKYSKMNIDLGFSSGM